MLTSMASTGAVSLINNQGNLGAALKDTFSSGNLKNAAIGGLTAGALSYADSTWFKPTDGATNGGSQVTTLGPVQNPGYSSQMLDWSNAADTALRSGAHAVISSGISTAINGGSFGSNLGSALINEGIDLGAAAGNKEVGDLAAELKVAPGTATTMMLHAMLGGLISVAKGQDFTSGAIAGGVAEGLTPIANGLLAQYVSDKFEADDLSQQGSQDKIATAQIIGLLSASLAGGDAATGSMIGGTGEKYNAEGHAGHKSSTEEVDGEIRKELGEHLPVQEQEDLGDETIQIDPGLSPGVAIGASSSGSSGIGGSGSDGTAARGSDAEDFFKGTSYTDKVLGQIKGGDFHAFPESVITFQGAGTVTQLTGRDGIVRDILKIPGDYQGKEGVFEFIKEPDGSINHRLFRPGRGE
ncbi:DUF637 domain-containing protein [Pseudomonas gingeri]|uniref:DUF637 domain-containing protein n=1 Tax=Pseudomonas gingeri TaxID=117681 RepID=UPI003FA01542